MHLVIRACSAAALALLATAAAQAQDTARAPRDSAAHGMPMPMSMSMPSEPLGIPMTRMGSGTSWLPDAAPMRADHIPAGRWLFMLHYLAFATYDHQESQRPIDGSAQINGIDWFMAMAQHDLGPGRLTLRAMISTEPLTVGKAGYPLLLQSGETYRGQALHDRQHPHDLFMELAPLYDVPLASDLGLELYAAPVGDPALGPVAYPHRPSAADDPYAPLGHHWQDATHITFGVATVGLFTRTVKLEGSIFNGREPDETRTNIDLRTLDSYSGRITVVPASAWSLSAWYGYLKSPEQLDPTVSQHRMGASILFDHPLDGTGEWSSALIYGANLYSNSRQLSNSVTLENTVDVDRHNSLFARIEYVNKDAGDLVLRPLPPSDRFDIEAVTLGYTRDLFDIVHTAIGAGGVATLDMIPGSLAPYYGTRTPYGFGIFLRLRPSDRHTLAQMQDMQTAQGR
jgi:hypothetical protein